MEGSWKPVLQLVHVTDLHVKDTTANPQHALNGGGRWIARTMQHFIEKWDIGGWDSGTQGHFPSAPESFRRFLVGWRELDPAWFDAPIWLVDTGDRTAFGDEDSIAAGARYLSLWQKALGDCPIRSLYGNHDAWPGTLPGLLPRSIQAQRDLLAGKGGWNPADWLREPLSIVLPDGRNRIELFGLDSVSWGAVLNTRAVGEIDANAQEALVARMRISAASKTGGLRILAMHHPLSFPWESEEVRAAGVFSAMKLLRDEDHGKLLRNDSNDPEGFGPLMHLILSGHTHLAHPASGLSGDVVGVHQACLGPYQLQLVGGSLMLNKSRKAAKAVASNLGMTDRKHAQFLPSTVHDANCQAQILRFMASPDQPGLLQMIRIPVYSTDGSLYEAGDPDGLTLCYDIP